MAARDLFHDSVKHALEREGWIITHDPFSLQVGTVEMYIDLGAERLLAAEKMGEKIAVEIKSFVQASVLYEFHLALGQYRNYQLALMQRDPERLLYLAVPDDTYDCFLTLPFIQDALRYNDVRYLVYNPQVEVIVRWHP